MSFDVYVQAFAAGEPGVVDVASVRTALSAYLDLDDTTSGVVRITTDDGGADLHGYENLESGFFLNAIEGVEVWNVLVRTAAAARLVILPVGGPIAVTDRDVATDLPTELQLGPVALVTSGGQLIALIEEEFWACPVCFEPVLATKPYESWPPERPGATAPYEVHLGLPSYEVCPSCGFEFGFDDNPGTAPGVSFGEYRTRWEQDGSPIFSSANFLTRLEQTSRGSQPSAHEIEIVEKYPNPTPRWKCSCGASSKGHWFASPQEAMDAAQLHKVQSSRA